MPRRGLMKYKRVNLTCGCQIWRPSVAYLVMMLCNVHGLPLAQSTHSAIGCSQTGTAVEFNPTKGAGWLLSYTRLKPRSAVFLQWLAELWMLILQFCSKLVQPSRLARDSIWQETTQHVLFCHIHSFNVSPRKNTSKSLFTDSKSITNIYTLCIPQLQNLVRVK